MKRQHGNTPVLICPHCGQTFKNDPTFRNHLQKNHEAPKYECQYCGKKFKKKIYKDDHEATHTGIPREICEQCNATFNSHGSYAAHKRRHHPKEYEQEKAERQKKKYNLE